MSSLAEANKRARTRRAASLKIPPVSDPSQSTLNDSFDLSLDRTRNQSNRFGNVSFSDTMDMSSSDRYYNSSSRNASFEMSGSLSDRYSSSTSSSSTQPLASSRQRRSEQQLFLANRSTLPENTPSTCFTSSSYMMNDDYPRAAAQRRMSCNYLESVTEQPEDECEDADEKDTPQFLVFRRRPAMARRSSAWV